MVACAYDEHELSINYIEDSSVEIILKPNIDFKLRIDFKPHIGF